MTAARTVIGPLTTTFTPAGYCSNVILGCPYTCDYGWQAQNCGADGYISDATTCWPPASRGAPTPTPAFFGWGFYSPGLHCPTGWVSACSATAGGSTGWVMEYSMLPGETAIGCCPSGYACDGGGAQTCQSIATKGATVPVVTCDYDTSLSSYLALPTVTTVVNRATATSNSAELTTFTFSTMALAAPMIEIRWHSSDRPSAVPASASSSSTTSPTSTPTSTHSHSTGSAPSSASPTSTANSDSLSTGEKAAIGVIVPVAVLAILAGFFFFFWRRKKRSSRADEWPRPDSVTEVGEQPSEVRSYRKPDNLGQQQPAAQELDAGIAARELDGRADKGVVR